jgi:pyruvate formate lyase activating enzyme
VNQGLVFNLQQYSLHDGPGIRTTVFLKGCPLRCAWCHNPESIAPRREILVVENRCAACGECRRACPFGEAVAGEGPLPARNDPCVFCGECAEACPFDARRMAGREMTVAEVMKAVLRDRVFYEESGGGVTLSGGEPLLQPRFVLALLEACRERGLHTALDTCGFGCTDDLLAMGRLADLVLFDVKLMDDARHRQHCGASNRPILENLRALASLGRRIWLRVPVIPGVNDDEANLAAIAQLAARTPGVEQINLLPYHNTGVTKARRLGREAQAQEREQPEAEQMERAAGRFRATGLKVVLGG